jgi:hypothetical protein
VTLISGESHNIEDNSSKNSEVDKNLNHPESALTWCGFNTILIGHSFILKLIVSIQSKTVTHNMFSCKNVHKDSSDLVSVQVTDFRGSTNWIWLDVSSIFLEPRPLPVQKKAEHQASHLHLEDTLCVIQDTCILDQVKLIGFASTLVI